MHRLLLAALLLPLGACATLQGNRTAEALVTVAAAPATSFLVDALSAEVAKLPTDPANLRGFLVLEAGLSDADADFVVAHAGGELAALLDAVVGYVDGGALPRAVLAVLTRADARTFGAGEVGKLLLAWARAHVDGALP